MLVQIYEVTNPADAAALSAMGVDHVGVLVGVGAFPREQSTGRAREIFGGLHSGAKACALNLSGDLQAIAQIVRELAPDILHLGAAPERLSPEQVRKLKIELPGLFVMRSIPVVDETSIAIAQAYDRVADLLLLDSHAPGNPQVGALGVTHDWDLDRRIAELVSVPVIIAGGLGPENVAAAIATAHPAGVDSKTMTDRQDGSHAKDLDRVRAFVAAARAASEAR